MVTQYDDKGKIFTQVVSKEPIEVKIMTQHNLISGLIHVRRDIRIKDELNQENRFLAVTDAVIYNHRNEELYRTNFLIVNVSHIIWVIPAEELQS